MTTIQYVTGDATQPHGTDNRLICHVVNNVGAWGTGFTRALDARWPEVGQGYKGWYQHRHNFSLGEMGCFEVEPGLTVANMIAQRGLIGPDNPTPIDYAALDYCLPRVAYLARAFGYSIHMPRIGCGLAGGSWERVEPLIVDRVCSEGVPVTVYDLAKEGA